MGFKRKAIITLILTLIWLILVPGSRLVLAPNNETAGARLEESISAPAEAEDGSNKRKLEDMLLNWMIILMGQMLVITLIRPIKPEKKIVIKSWGEDIEHVIESFGSDNPESWKIGYAVAKLVDLKGKIDAASKTQEESSTVEKKPENKNGDTQDKSNLQKGIVESKNEQ